MPTLRTLSPLALALALGCGGDNGYAVDLTVTVDPSVPSPAGITQLAVAVAGAETYTTTVAINGQLASGGAHIIYRPGVKMGTLSFTATAKDASGAAVAQGSAPGVVLQPGATVMAAILLRGGVSPDGGTDDGAAPSCTDGVKNGDESDVDCGGATCPACIAGQTCAKPTDCASNLCGADGTCHCMGFGTCPTGQMCDATSGACFSPPLASKPSSVGGMNPVSLAAGDLDCDGRPDIVVGNGADANMMGSAVSWGFGAGDGTFVSGMAKAFTQGVFAVAIGDLNHDALPDVVVAFANGPTGAPGGVQVFLNMGGRMFSTGAFVALNQPPNQLLVADVNHDGAADVIAADTYSGGTGQSSIALLLADGMGGLARPLYASLQSPAAMAWSSLGGNNGSNDQLWVLSSASGGTLHAFRFDGTALVDTNMSIPIAATMPSGFVMADLNGDGATDLAVAEQSSSVNVFLQMTTQDSMGFTRGTGAFPAMPSQSLSGAMHPSGLVAMDVDLDGHLDLLDMGDGGSGVPIFRGQPDGTFAAPILYSSNDINGFVPAFIAAGDLNGDGKPDVVASTRSGSVVALLDAAPALKTLAFAAQTPLPVGAALTDGGVAGGPPVGAIVAQFVDTELPEALVVEKSALEALIGTPKGFVPFSGANFPPVNAPVGVTQGNLDDDGQLDVVIANGDKTLTLLTSAGGSCAASPCPVPTAPAAIGSVALGDVNGDGLGDIVAGQVASGAVQVFLAKTVDYYPGPTAVTTGLGDTSLVAVGDLDHDCKMDIVAAGPSGIAAIRGATLSQQFAATGTTVIALALADLDGDGNLDAVVADGSGKVDYLPGDGKGGFGGVSKVIAPSAALALAVGDFDHDGTIDVAFAGASSVGVVPGKGGGAFGAVVTVPVAADLLYAADLNLDGKLDLATFSKSGSSETSILNQSK